MHSDSNGSGLSSSTAGASTGQVQSVQLQLAKKCLIDLENIALLDNQLMYAAANDTGGSDLYLHDTSTGINWLVHSGSEGDIAYVPGGFVDSSTALLTEVDQALPPKGFNGPASDLLRSTIVSWKI